MNDKLAEALAIIRAEFGFETLSAWAPGDEDGDVEALFFAKDENALMAAALSYVTGDKTGS